MHEYRIKEVNPYTFEIEVKKVIVKGFLFWKRKIVEWHICDCEGKIFEERPTPYPTYVNGTIPRHTPKCGPFVHEAAAQHAIDKFRAIQKYSEEEFKKRLA